MDIKEIALKVADSLRNKVDGILHMQSNQGLARFAEALIESYKAELLKEAGEPVVCIHHWHDFGSLGGKNVSRCGKCDALAFTGNEPDTSDQVAAAIIKATKPLEDQLTKAEQLWQIAQGRCDGLEEKLAKAEQRVAEACALQVATETRFHWLDAARVAKEIRSGEWRKFVKEV